MPNEDELKVLSAFTPATAGIDRDAILFAAGRAAGTASRKWKALASLLATTQAATLAMFLLPTARMETPKIPAAPMESAIAEGKTMPPDPTSWLALHRSLDLDAMPPHGLLTTVRVSEPTLTPMTRPESIP